MTRIGFAFNLKPESTEHTSDEFAEWDSRETIDAVAGALSRLGEVIRLEANETFPENLRREKPDAEVVAARKATVCPGLDHYQPWKHAVSLDDVPLMSPSPNGRD